MSDGADVCDAIATREEPDDDSKKKKQVEKKKNAERPLTELLAYALNNKAYLCGMPITPEALSLALSRLKITKLNAMQEAARTTAAEHPNVLLLAATGSGKTLAFLLPVWDRIDTTQRHTQIMIVVPSRELALQVDEVVRQLQTGFKTTLCYGGHKREIEENNLREAPLMVIGTPGRLGDHIRRGNLQTDQIHTLVLDEFDKSLELGFMEEMAFLAASLPARTSTLLSSATQAVELPEFLRLTDVFTLDYLSQTQKEAHQLEYFWVISEQKDKLDTLQKLLGEVAHKPCIVFCNHRDAVERVHAAMTDAGLQPVFYHGGMEQHPREVALCKFRNGTARILITTDIAARGLDIAHVRNIIHYHLPATAEVYTHRNGRTARMEASGQILLIRAEDEDIPEFIPADLPVFPLPEKAQIPEKPIWGTLFIAAGKKDKISKMDIVGFLIQKGGMRKEDIGLIDVFDYSAFVAVRKNNMNGVLAQIRDQRIKNKKVVIAPAR